MTVWLVGAGPGDPGLLTVRAAEVLRDAEVVVHDRLAGSAVLDLAPATAERISVGKSPRRPSGAWSGEQGPSTPQEEINRLLVEHGRAGRRVVRLKGGDPFVFGRGGEEAQALAAAGVPFEVVPGISSAVAVPAYGGVPVTHRGLSTSFTVVTGHEDPWAATETDWEAVARVGGTIVVLMGTATRAAIARRLVDGGLAPETPVAAVTWGTRPEQSTVRTTLAGLGDAPVEAPAVIVIGPVAGLDLSWFENRPLFGKRIQVTSDPGGLAATLGALGADVILTPAIEVVDVPFDVPDVASYDWVLFTSASAVERFVPALRDARVFGAARVAAVGPATAAALRAHRVEPDLVPDDAIADALLAALPDAPCRALFPAAAEVRPTLPDGLRARGWVVDVLTVYETGRRPAQRTNADAITFLSPSAVDAYRSEPLPPVVVCIGPVTAAGLSGAIVADPHTADGVVAALVRELSR